MADVDDLFAALDALLGARDGSSAVVTVGDDTHYAQFLADEDGGLLAEVVGNRHLPDAARLSPAQEDQLRARGWALGDGGNWVQWDDAPTPQSARALALDALAALDEVHGASGAVRVEAALAAPADPSAPVPDRRAVLVAVIAALVALAGAVAAFLAAA